MNNYKLEEVAAETLEQMLTVYTKASRQAHSFLGEENIQLASNMVRDMFFPNPDVTSIAVMEGDELAGFVGIVGTEVGGLFVDPKHQGKGYGKILLMHAVEEYNCDKLEVFIKNEKTQGFYKAMGFEMVGTTDEPTFGEHAYIMNFKK